MKIVVIQIIVMVFLLGCASKPTLVQPQWEDTAADLGIPLNELLHLKNSAEENFELVVLDIRRDGEELIVYMSKEVNSSGGLAVTYTKCNGQWIVHPDYYGAPWDIQ